MKKVKVMTREERIKWLRTARGRELLRAYHLSFYNYDANDPDKEFQYNSVREELLRRL